MSDEAGAAAGGTQPQSALSQARQAQPLPAGPGEGCRRADGTVGPKPRREQALLRQLPKRWGVR